MTQDGHHVKKHSLSAQQLKFSLLEESVFRFEADYNQFADANGRTPRFAGLVPDEAPKAPARPRPRLTEDSLSDAEKFDKLTRLNESHFARLREQLDEKLVLAVLADLYSTLLVSSAESQWPHGRGSR